MNLFPGTRATRVRAGILIVWLLLFAALLRREVFVQTLDLRETQALRKARDESWLGVYFRESRIGYVRNRVTPAPESGALRLDQEARMNLNILGEVHPVAMELTAELSPDALLRSFQFSFHSTFYAMQARGTVAGSTVRFTLTTGKETVADTLQLPSPPFLATSERGYLLREGLAPGTRVKVPYFDPVSLAGKESLIEYRGREKTLIVDRIFNLHHFVETFAGVPLNIWLDDEGRVVKEDSPSGFVFVREPEFKAKAITGKGQELLTGVAVTPKGVMPPDLASAEALRLRLTLPSFEGFLLEGGRQSLDGDILTIRRERLPGPAAPPCADEADALAATPFIQAAHPKIAAQAAAIAGDAANAPEKVRRLAAWVHETLDKRPVIGIPDAVATLAARQGDCNEHAVLFAALARNLGIPTRVAAGVVHLRDAFFYHAWNEVCLDGAWLSVDTTVNQIPADVSHVRLVTGETAEIARIGAVVGTLGIEVLP